MKSVTQKEAYLELANAIISRACDDYKAGDDRVKGFFKSEWFILLSRGSVSGETVLNFLDEERKNVKCRMY